MRPEATIAKWMSTPWALEPRHFDAGLQRLLSLDISARDAVRIRAAMQDSSSPRAQQDMDGFSGRRVVDYEPNDAGLAIIPINGLLMKEIPGCMYFVEGETGTAYEDVRVVLERALDDRDVRHIVLSIDSPGGYVAGGQDLADAIKAAAQEKPITAAVQDLAASGAYWLASQADEIVANRTAQIGSIGVYSVAYDFSRLLKNEGIETHLISSGGIKGQGIMGSEITDELVAIWREEIVGLKDLFVEAVATGRDMSIAAVQKLATGRVWLAAEALQLGLIDRVENFDATLARLAGGVS